MVKPVILRTTDASGGATNSNVYVVDSNTMAGFQIGFGVIVTGTVSYTVQHTFDDIQGLYGAPVLPTAAVWFDHASVAAQTANKDGNYAFPCTAIRIRQATGSGSTRMVVIQQG